MPDMEKTLQPGVILNDQIRQAMPASLIWLLFTLAQPAILYWQTVSSVSTSSIQITPVSAGEGENNWSY